MKVSKETKLQVKLQTPCKVRKYWFDRNHSWRHLANARKAWVICNHCLMVIELIGEDDL